MIAWFNDVSDGIFWVRVSILMIAPLDGAIFGVNAWGYTNAPATVGMVIGGFAGICLCILFTALDHLAQYGRRAQAEREGAAR